MVIKVVSWVGRVSGEMQSDQICKHTVFPCMIYNMEEINFGCKG